MRGMTHSPSKKHVVRPGRRADRAELVRMMCQLLAHDGITRAEATAEVRKWFADGQGLFVLDREGRGLSAFVHVGERLYAEGCDSSPVASAEEWFVDRGVRRKGVGRALMVAAEQWALQQGHTELASDTQLWNVRSQRAHARLGFRVAEKLVSFMKPLHRRKLGKKVSPPET